MKKAVIALVGLAVVGAFAAWRIHAARTQIEAGPAVTAPQVDPGEVRFLKGQTHAHSNNSGDSKTPPADVGRWYAEHGFDFVVFTDHNFVTTLASSAQTLFIPGVELTQSLQSCEDPTPLPSMHCLLHVNALFVDPAKVTTMPPAPDETRVELFTRALKATAAMNGLAQVNHPNFEYSADAKVLTELTRRGARFLEIANEATDSSNGGDATHPNTEALWDAVLSEGLTLYGVATDDAHHYYDAAQAKRALVGNRGFVMVRARKDFASIRDAMARGDFYASTGLLFTKLEMTSSAIELQTDADADFRCVGEHGKILSQSYGRELRCEVPATGYVRAVATKAAGVRAWTQPLRAAAP